MKRRLALKVGPAGADKDRRRNNILKVAYAAFLREGYSATSMARIAVLLGGSKATLYNYFPSKKELFNAVLDKKCRDIQVGLFDVESPANFSESFKQFVERAVRLTLLDENIATFRLVTAECTRFPEVGHSFYASDRDRVNELFVAYFESAIKAGELKQARPDDMAALFRRLLSGPLFLQKLWNMNSKPSEKEIHAEISQIVGIFLALYAPMDKRETHTSTRSKLGRGKN